MNALERKLNAGLIQALSALSDMWNQYCPPPMGHAYMSSGEFAEEVLETWGLMDADGNASEPQWAEDTLPPRLTTPPPSTRPLSSLTDAEAADLYRLAFVGKALDYADYEPDSVLLHGIDGVDLWLFSDGDVLAQAGTQSREFTAGPFVRYLDSLGIALGV